MLRKCTVKSVRFLLAPLSSKHQHHPSGVSFQGCCNHKFGPKYFTGLNKYLKYSWIYLMKSAALEVLIQSCKIFLVQPIINWFNQHISRKCNRRHTHTHTQTETYFYIYWLLNADDKNFKMQPQGFGQDSIIPISSSLGMSVISLWRNITKWGLRLPGECLPQCFLMTAAWLAPRNFVDVDSNVVFSCQRCNDVTALEDVKTSQWSWLWDIPLCEY